MKPASDAAQQWQQAVVEYTQYINDYVARGDASGWKKMGEPKPAPDLQALLPELLAQLRAANALGTPEAIAAVREHWPPMYEATQSLLDDNGQGIGALAWLPGGELLARIGVWHEPGRTVIIRNQTVMDMPEVDMLGASPRQRVLATVANGVISLRSTADMSLLAEFPAPQGHEGLPARAPADPEGSEAEDLAQETSRVQQLIPFDDGSAVVVVQSEGIFLVTQEQVQRLLPEAAELEELADDDGVYLDMCHAAVSPDGRFIACGEQDGRHSIFEAQGQLLDRIGPHGEYPHHAAFFADSQHVALNACHFYQGGTIAVATDAFGSVDTDFYDEHPAITRFEGAARVYASAPVGDALVLGDAHGYLWTRNAQGDLLWKQHVGSTITAMAVSPDGQRLAVGTYAGVIHLIDLSNTDAAPGQVGVGARRELGRWLFWKQEERPLYW